MRINVLNTTMGLIPLDLDDHDEKKKLKIGEVYEASIVLKRNYRLHKLFFALINCAFEYLNDEQTERLGGYNRIGKENFRKDMLIAAGVTTSYYSAVDGDFRVEAKSLAFDRMDDAEFRDVYDAVKDAIFRTVLRGISEEEFNKRLIGF